MENEGNPRLYLRLEDALRAMADADTIRELLVDARQVTEIERHVARGALQLAMAREIEVFQIVLDAMCMEVIVPGREARYRRSALEVALEEGMKSIVMAVVERMRGHVWDDKLACFPMDSLFKSRLFADEEVVEGVVGVLPRCAFGPGSRYNDCLDHGIRVKGKENRKRAVDLVLRLGPPMAERIAGWERLGYVAVAAEVRDLEMVERMHDLVPLLPDGSGRRAEDEDYVPIVLRAAHHAADNAAIIEYLLKQSSEMVFDLHNCDAGALLRMNAEGAEWLALRAPHLLEGACEQVRHMHVMDFALSPAASVLEDYMVRMADPSEVSRLMRQRSPSPRRFAWPGSNGWMWRLKKLHEAVPESMDGLRWPWLMEATGDKEYGDVEYMLGMCTREHLVMRNEEGDTAYDVAARDEKFPEELLARLKVVTKGAQV